MFRLRLGGSDAVTAMVVPLPIDPHLPGRALETALRRVLRAGCPDRVTRRRAGPRRSCGWLPTHLTKRKR